MIASVAFSQGRGPGGTQLTAEEMLAKRLERLTTLLSLDATQQAKAKTIFTDELTAATALRTNEQTARDALNTAVKASASDAQLDQLAAALGVIEGQMAAVHAKAQVKFRAILNSTQLEKLDALDDHGPQN